MAPHRDLTLRWRSYCLEIRDAVALTEMNKIALAALYVALSCLLSIGAAATGVALV